MFNDRILVESPGDLPGIVRLTNMREFHFSRNPKIAAFLHDYEYVEEFGEGIDRMFNEMEKAGLPAPEYRNESFMRNAVIRNGIINDTINETKAENETINDTTNEIITSDDTTNDTINEIITSGDTINDTINEIIAPLAEKYNREARKRQP